MRVFALLMAMVMACGICSPVFAGDLDPAAAPGSTSSYTLDDLWNRLNDGTAGSQSSFTEPTSGPTTGTGHTLNQIMSIAPEADDTDGATTADVASGKTFWGLTSGTWGLQTGTASGGGSCGVPETGQTTQYDTNTPQADDGGTDPPGDALPNPRFTNNNDGTVTDNLTGLIWLKNANCANAKRDWQTALNDVVSLNTNGTMNSNNCGDASNSGNHQTDWRLPTVRELQSLIHYGYDNPALSNTEGTAKWTEGDPFTNVQSAFYWSSSTYADSTTDAWYAGMYGGYVYYDDKTAPYYVWAVRGGQ